MRNSRGFTLIEMLVVVLVIVILIAITLAVGAQVQASSQMSLTKSELAGLVGALQWYEHKSGGQIPTDMLSFLEGYQRMHAYEVGGVWRQHKNFLTSLPASQVVTWVIPPPGVPPASTTYTNGLPAVIEVLDAWSNPIQYCPPMTIYYKYMNSVNPDYAKTGPYNLLYPYPQYFTSPSQWQNAAPPWNYNPPNAPIYTYLLPTNSSSQYVTGGTGVTQFAAMPPAFVFLPGDKGGYNNFPTPPSYNPPTPGFHAPCFYSYGPTLANYGANAGTGLTAVNDINPTVYIYSSNP